MYLTVKQCIEETYCTKLTNLAAFNTIVQLQVLRDAAFSCSLVFLLNHVDQTEVNALLLLRLVHYLTLCYLTQKL